MSEPRFQRRDLAAVVLVALAALVVPALLSFDPADLPGGVYPVHPTPRNWLGRGGAWLARGLLDALGVAVIPFLAAWLTLAVLLMKRGDRTAWGYRLTGWLLLMPAAGVAAEWLRGRWAGWTITGPGGSIGAWLAAGLERLLRPPGQWVVVAALLFLGLVLALDPLLLLLLRTLRAALRLALRRPHPTDTPELAAPEAQADDPAPIPPLFPQPPVWDTAGQEGPITIPINRYAQSSNDRSRRADPEIARFPGYELPPLSLLQDPRPFDASGHEQQLRDRAALLEKTFADFGLRVQVVGINTGPVVTQYEIALETGLRVAKVTRLADDIALNLRVPSVRMVTPIPGRNTVGVEIPNELRAEVRLKEVIQASAKRVGKARIPLFLGKDSEGRPLVHDLADMPHLLIAGATGTGKSVCLNALILSMLMTRRPDEVKLILIDPKMTEMIQYGRVPHLMHPVVKDMKKAEAILAWAVDKMEERYDLMSRARVRNIASYNELKHDEILRRLQPADEDERRRIPAHLPYIVIVMDEVADLILLLKKEVEGHIIRLAQKSRAAGIHLILATQKPTVDVITGLIKSNMPSRICFKVVNKSDSRVVLDEMGAEKLLGQGDMLFLQPGTCNLVRGQGAYASDDEIQRVVSHLECDPCYSQELIELKTTSREDEPGSPAGRSSPRDELYDAAVEVVLRENRGSTSLLQRALGIGYGRAARLIDIMAENGVVGPYNGSSAREVLLTPEQWAASKGEAS
jgi:S-DNA-T family DNA segregation ATPase FtsK/SpoIIIE